MRRSWPWRGLPARAADRLLAGLLLAWALFDVPWWWRPPGHGGPALVILSVAALAVAQSVPFLWRRTQPAAVLAVTAAALGIKYAAHHNLWSAGAAVLAAAYGLGTYGNRAGRQACRVLAVAAVVTSLVALQADRDSHTAAVACALLATACVLGEVTSSHRDLAAASAAHARDLERAAVAREVHDLVAHHLSAIAVQAGAARLASAQDPQAAPQAVAAIERGARGGLAELSTLVRRLREPAAGENAQPGLSDLPVLVDSSRRSGLRIELRVDGVPGGLAAAADLAGYRVVQESLTNVIRYAPGADVTIDIGYRADGVVVDVADSGPAGPACAAAVPARPGGGTGLAGLTDRARLLGGSLEAGSRPEGGFRVSAFLPAAR